MASPLRVILVGCGGISRTWLNAIRDTPEIALVGLVDLNLEATEQRATEYNFTDLLLSTDLTAALETTRPDVVLDCTVPEAHVAVTLEALAHGCHVLGEKPLADTMDNAHKMVNAARQAGRLYAVMQNRRHNPALRRLRRFLDSGAIGSVTSVHSDFFIGAHFGGFRDHMQHVLLLDMAIHTFDAARFLTRADPLSVFCHEWNPNGSWYDHDASAIAVYQMTGSIVYSYRGSWCAEGLQTPWESEWRLIGQKGTVKWDGSDSFAAQVVAEKGGFYSKLQDIDLPSFDDEVNTNGHASLIKDFIRCIHAGTVPDTVCSDNIKSLGMVFGAIASAEQGQTVQIAW